MTRTRADGAARTLSWAEVDHGDRREAQLGRPRPHPVRRDPRRLDPAPDRGVPGWLPERRARRVRAAGSTTWSKRRQLSTARPSFRATASTGRGGRFRSARTSWAPGSRRWSMRADWAKTRKLDATNAAQAPKLSKSRVFEPTMTITGATADERFAVRPGDELKIALAIAHELIVTGKAAPLRRRVPARSPATRPKPSRRDRPRRRRGRSSRRSPSDLWARARQEPRRRRRHRLADDATRLRCRSRSTSSTPRSTTKAPRSTARLATGRSAAASPRSSSSSRDEGRARSTRSSFIAPIRLTPPAALGFAEAIAKVPLVVPSPIARTRPGSSPTTCCRTTTISRTGATQLRAGLYSLQQPDDRADPFDTRAFQDTLIAWTKARSRRPAALSGERRLARLPHGATGGRPYIQSGAGGTFEQFWEGALRTGVLVTARQRGAIARARSMRARSRACRGTRRARRATPSSGALRERSRSATAAAANNAWLQELPDPISSVTWDNYLQRRRPRSRAKELGLKNDDVVEVTTGDISVELPVYVQPGLHPEVVSVGGRLRPHGGGQGRHRRGRRRLPVRQGRGHGTWSSRASPSRMRRRAASTAWPPRSGIRSARTARSSTT